jgi:threonine/homoserine/homoserine lactone efflux protein
LKEEVELMLPDISASAWLGFAVASFAVAGVPGPSWIYVITSTLGGGRGRGLLAVAGNGCGIVVHVLAAAFGLSVVLTYSTFAFGALKMLGAAYLVFLAAKLLLSSESAIQTREDAHNVSSWTTYRDGVLVNVFNPKVAVLMLALLPQFTDPALGLVSIQLVMLGLLHVVVASSLLSCLALFVHRVKPMIKAAPVYERRLKWGAAAILLGFGVKLLWTQR